MRGTPSTSERSRRNSQSLRPAGEKVAWPQPMTDEGDHGGAPVLDGPLRTAAPTKAIVTLCRGGCPHPPVRWPSHPTRPTLIRPFGAPSPWKGEGFIRSDASFPSPCVGILQSSPAAMPAPFHKGAYLSSTSAPLVKGGTPPKAEGGFRPPVQSLPHPGGKALSIPTQPLKTLRRSPHPALRATFPQGKADSPRFNLPFSPIYAIL